MVKARRSILVVVMMVLFLVGCGTMSTKQKFYVGVGIMDTVNNRAEAYYNLGLVSLDDIKVLDKTNDIVNPLIDKSWPIIQSGNPELAKELVSELYIIALELERQFLLKGVANE